MAARFVVKKGGSGKFRFNLLASNGKVIATSEAYETKRAALEGIQSVKKSAGDADVDDQTTKGGRSSKDATNKKTVTKGRNADDRPKDQAEEPKQDGAEQRSDDRSDEDTGDLEMNLGPCHFCGEDEPATAMATRNDGTGWIAVCDEHKDKAGKEGWEVGDDVEPPASS